MNSDAIAERDDLASTVHPVPDARERHPYDRPLEKGSECFYVRSR